MHKCLGIKCFAQGYCGSLMMLFMKQPSESLKVSPGSPSLFRNSTLMKTVKSLPAGSSSMRIRSRSSIGTTLPMQGGLQTHCFRDDLWIEDEKKRQRRLTRGTAKRGTHPLEEIEEVRCLVEKRFQSLSSLFSSLLSMLPFIKSLCCLSSLVFFDVCHFSKNPPLLLYLTLAILFCTLLAVCSILSSPVHNLLFLTLLITTLTCSSFTSR